MAPAASSPMAPHVAVVAFPFSSHAAVLLAFSRALAAAAAAQPGATLSFLSTAASIAYLRKAAGGAELPRNLRFVEVPDGVSAAAEKGADAVPVPRQMALFMAAAEAGGVKAGLDAARAAAGGARVTCVVGDAFVWPAADAAAASGAPWVPVWTAASCALLAHLRTDALREDIGDQAASRAEELLVSHPGLGSYRVRDLPDGVVSGDFNYVINLLIHRMAQRLPHSATAVALNTFPGLDPPDVTAALSNFLPNCLPFGPYHLLLPSNSATSAAADPHGCLAWLDRHPPRAVAYVSFGTVATPRADELAELAAGLEATGAPFLWSLREDSWPLLPAGFLDRAAAAAGGTGLVVPWAPQVAVLRHRSVGAFVTHAGWASVMEGVASGVPMACRPFFGDQRMNARSVARVWGFGKAFEGGAMTRDGVAEAVEAMLRGEEGERMRARAKELQDMVAMAFAPGGECRRNFDEFVGIVCRV